MLSILTTVCAVVKMDNIGEFFRPHLSQPITILTRCDFCRTCPPITLHELYNLGRRQRVGFEVLYFIDG